MGSNYTVFIKFIGAISRKLLKNPTGFIWADVLGLLIGFNKDWICMVLTKLSDMEIEARLTLKVKPDVKVKD